MLHSLVAFNMAVCKARPTKRAGKAAERVSVSREVDSRGKATGMQGNPLAAVMLFGVQAPRPLGRPHIHDRAGMEKDRKPEIQQYSKIVCYNSGNGKRKGKDSDHG